MALIEGRAFDRVASDALSGLACVRLGAEVGVVAGFSVTLCGVVAHSGRGIAGSGDVALVYRRAFDRVVTNTLPALAAVRLGAEVGVVTRSAAWFFRIFTKSILIADPRIVALIDGRAIAAASPAAVITAFLVYAVRQAAVTIDGMADFTLPTTCPVAFRVEAFALEVIAVFVRLAFAAIVAARWRKVAHTSPAVVRHSRVFAYTGKAEVIRAGIAFIGAGIVVVYRIADPLPADLALRAAPAFERASAAIVVAAPAFLAQINAGVGRASAEPIVAV